jgi:hypothetical protein
LAGHLVLQPLPLGLVLLPQVVLDLLGVLGQVGDDTVPALVELVDLVFV